MSSQSTFTPAIIIDTSAFNPNSSSTTSTATLLPTTYLSVPHLPTSSPSANNINMYLPLSPLTPTNTPRSATLAVPSFMLSSPSTPPASPAAAVLRGTNASPEGASARGRGTMYLSLTSPLAPPNTPSSPRGFRSRASSSASSNSESTPSPLTPSSTTYLSPTSPGLRGEKLLLSQQREGGRVYDLKTFEVTMRLLELGVGEKGMDKGVGGGVDGGKVGDNLMGAGGLRGGFAV